MNIIEAVELMREGRKVRVNSWLESIMYVYSNKDNIIVDQRGITIILSMRDILANDWEIYEEKTKLHSFEDALKALKNGKTIGRKSLLIRYSLGSSSNPDFKIHDVLANDWIILENEED